MMALLPVAGCVIVALSAGEVFEESYENCGSFGPDLNVYWTYSEPEQQLSVLFEALDTSYRSFGFSDPDGRAMDGANVVLGCQDWNVEVPADAFPLICSPYHSFGFSDPDGRAMDGANVVLGCQDWNADLPAAYHSFGFSDPDGRAMDGANVVLGCQDWSVEVPADAFEIALPAQGEIRNSANVVAGIGENQLGAVNLEQLRVNGACGVQFERSAILADVNGINVNDGHDIVEGTANTIVYAAGSQASPTRHARRGFGTQDFILGEGIISTGALVTLLVPEETTPPVDPEPPVVTNPAVVETEPPTTTATDPPAVTDPEAATPTGTDPDENGTDANNENMDTDSASVASMSSIMIGAVAVLAAALC